MDWNSEASFAATCMTAALLGVGFIYALVTDSKRSVAAYKPAILLNKLF